MTIKAMMLGRRRPGQTVAEQRAHMKDHHGRLVLDYIAAEPENAPRRYVQNHAFDGIYPGGDGLAGAFSSGLDFFTEISFPDIASLKASRETPYYLEHLQPDEGKMVDIATVIGIPFKEETLRAPDAGSGPFIKVFLVWHKAAPTVAALAEAIGAPMQDVSGYVRNSPAVPAPLSAVDEFWFAGEAEGLTFAQACRDAILARLPAEYSLFTVTVAYEYVLHAG